MTARDDPFGEIEELFDQFTEFGSALSGEVPVDVLDRDDEVVVLADLPGRDPDSIEVRLENERSLELEAPAPTDETEGRYVVRGRPRSDASRSVHLPAPVDENATEASYEQGVLTVRLGKPTGGDGTEIPVN
jgi:HSP20 family protein